MRCAAADLERALSQIPRLLDSFSIDRTNHDIDGVLLEALEFLETGNGNEFAIDQELLEALPVGPARDVRVKSFARLDQRRQHPQRAAPRRYLNLLHDAGEILFLDRQIALRTKLRAGLREKKPKKMINLRHGRDRRLSAAARDALLNRHRGGQAFNQIDIRFLELFDELPRIRRHAVEKTALALGKENVESQRRFAGSAQAGNDDQLVPRNID